ncbi:hypothetical protein PFICI_13703 [Pestalotiopsis fici W106-1]|uniref:Uncharacterized protein n=1 Tax=Pestalotiopsis fici (strain W106-1 / CGMCC3.15140) TaxID=1229662 RepID=W3WN79_PESFW|nr:uncharacterized protein PFICI_13703 [Pestalotiopsis fici W106-1]ETS75219.1 hypothetical protein PFICI_13703 [Pestalotiopsis fici W106-1]
MATATPSITSVLLFNTDEQTIVADVLGADATATTFLLNCPPGTDSDECGTYNETVVVGPWAKPTPPPDASTGVYDLEVNMGTEWFFHLHCDMSETVPVACTTTNLGGNDDGTPTATVTFASSDYSDLSFDWTPVTITAGLEMLASATGTGSAASSVSSATSTGGSVAVTQTGTAATASATNAAMLGRGEPFAAGSLALAGLALGWLLR